MRRLRSSLLLVILAVAALAQSASEKPSTDVRRVGAHLACKCGCTDSVSSCAMLECHFSKRTAQNYMRLARKEAEVCQMLAAKRHCGAYLTLNQALKFITTLSKKNSRRKRT